MSDKMNLAIFITVGICCTMPWGDGILVTTKYGDVKGRTINLPQAHGPITAVNTFLGIPYAQPPVGHRRFKAPLPPVSWKPQVKSAISHGNVCLQPRLDYFLNSIREVWPSFTWEDNSSEDCLYLNVYAPANDTSNSYPVMIFIHGGSYIYGTSARPQTPGDILPLWGVVLVTIQYRLGAFGFMTSGDSSAPGNYGMLDQVMAMKWVQENIVHFGGNPNNVTIFGVSAGGSSVGLHLLSPLSKGLFHQAIAESGVELSPFAFLPLEKAVAHTEKAAKQLGCDTTSTRAMIDCLRSEKVENILRHYKTGQVAAVIDNIFLTGIPSELRKAGKFLRVPFMAGFNSQDAAHNIINHDLTSIKSMDIFRKEIKVFAEKIAPLGFTVSIVPDAIEFQYTPWAEVQSADPAILYNKIVDMQTDYYIIAPTVKALTAHSKFAATFMYEFSHKSRYSKTVGVRHGENTDYDFGVPLLNSSSKPFSAQDQNVSRFLMTLYTNFAKYGRPTPHEQDGVIWKEFNATHQPYVRIQSPPEVGLNFQPQRMAFWNSYFQKLVAFTETCNEDGTCGSRPTHSDAQVVKIRRQFLFCATFYVWFLSSALQVYVLSLADVRL